jgi:hypothetical protein
VCKALSYFEINGNNFHALPLQKELSGSNVQLKGEAKEKDQAIALSKIAALQGHQPKVHIAAPA